jgi:hypothetical protein
LYNIIHYKSDTIAKAMETSPQNVTFRRDLSGQRFVSWNAFLQHFANVYLHTRPNGFCWKFHENGKFLVGSIYHALIQPDVPVDE